MYRLQPYISLCLADIDFYLQGVVKEASSSCAAPPEAALTPTHTHSQKWLQLKVPPNYHSSFWMRTLESMSCVAYQKSIFQIYSGSSNIVISFCQQENTQRCEQTADVHGSTSVLCKLHLLWFGPASTPTLWAQNLRGLKTSKHAVTNRFIQSCIRMLDVFSMTGSQIATIYQLPSFLSLHPAPLTQTHTFAA